MSICVHYKDVNSVCQLMFSTQPLWLTPTVTGRGEIMPQGASKYHSAVTNILPKRKNCLNVVPSFSQWLTSRETVEMVYNRPFRQQATNWGMMLHCEDIAFLYCFTLEEFTQMSKYKPHLQNINPSQFHLSAFTYRTHEIELYWYS